MYKFLLPGILFFIMNGMQAQNQVQKINSVSKSLWKPILTESYSGIKNAYFFSVNNQVYPDQLIMHFNDEISGIIISNAGLIGRLSPDAIFNFKIQVKGTDRSNIPVAYSIAGEDESDQIRKEGDDNIIIANALKAPLIILFDQPVFEVSIVGVANLPAQIKAAISIDGFMNGDWLKTADNSVLQNIDCQSRNTTFLVDVSESMGDDDLTYIANQIDQWIRKAPKPQEGAKITYSIFPFAGKVAEGLVNEAAGKISFQDIYNTLSDGKNQSKIHTNWIAALELASTLNAQQIVFITDGLHNGTDQLHDTLTNDLSKIASLAARIRTKAEVFAIGIDKLSDPSRGNILQILTGKEQEESITQHVLFDNMQDKWWMELGADENLCVKQEIDLNVSKTATHSLQLKWNAVKGADTYRIVRSSDGENFKKVDLNINTVSQGIYTAKDEKLEAGIYTYRVNATGKKINLSSNQRSGEINGIIEMFPNPAKDFIIAKISVKKSSAEHISVLNALGQIVNVSIEQISANAWQIHTQHLVPGTYILQYLDKSNSITEIKKFNII